MASRGEDEITQKMKKLKKRTGKRGGKAKYSKNKEIIADLKNSLDSKPKFTKMVEYSIECIKNLGVDEVSVEEMVEGGILESLFRVQKLNPYNEKIQRLVNSALETFAQNPELQKVIVAKMGTGGLVHSMKRHVEPETLISTCRVAKTLAKDSAGNVNKFVQGGMVPAVAHVVKGHADNEEILTEASGVLDEIVGHKDFALKAMKTNCVGHIVKGLSQFPENPVFVLSSASMIAKLAQSSEDITGKLKKMDAVDLLVNAIEFHVDNEEIMECGANALRYLAGEEDLQSAMISVGNNLATASAVSKVSSLVLVPENVEYMAKNDGIDWILAAIKSSLGDDSAVAHKILESGCRAIMRMAVDEHKIYQIMKKGGVKTVMEVLQQHRKDPKIAHAAMSCLSAMVTRKENAIYLAKIGAIKQAELTYKMHPDDEKIAKSYGDLIGRMAAHEALVGTLVKHGVIENVVDLLTRHGEDPVICMTAINTLGRMATSADNMGEITRAGGIEALVKVLGDQIDDIGVVKQALLLLDTAALLPANIQNLRRAGAMDAILAVLERYPEDAELQKIASNTMAMIAGEKELATAIANVQETSQGMITKPGLVRSLVDKYMNQLGLLSNLSMVDGNRSKIIKNGGVGALISAFEAAGQCPKGVKREKALLMAATGVCRMADVPEAAQQFAMAGMCEKMLAAAIHHPDNDFAEIVMMSTAKFACSQGSVKGMLDSGAIDQIIKMAQMHPLNESVLHGAAKALNALAVDDKSIQQIIAQGGAPIVVDSVYANMGNQAELADCLQCLATLAINEECATALLNAGAVDAILQAIRRYPDNEEIIGSGIQGLCRLLINEDVGLEIGEKNGCPLLVKAMRDHYKNEQICEIDMILLDSLASIKRNADDLLEPSLKTVELVKWIADGYASNSTLQESAERLLATLCPPKEPEIKVMEGNTKLDASKCDSMIAQLRSGDLNEGQTVAMCQSITNFCQDADNAVLMCKRGGMHCMAELMKANKSNENAYYAAASAFATLAENGGDEALALLEEAALMEALCEVMKPKPEFAQPMNLSDLTNAVSACARMKLKPQNVEEMMKNAPLESLMKILCESDDPLLLQQASRLLGKLSNEDDAANLLSQITNLRELIAAMRRNIKNQEFLKYGVYLLGNLAVSEELKSEIGIEGGVQLILQIMGMYPTNEGLMENCCYSLGHLSWENDVNNSFIVACKGIQLLISTMQIHSQKEDMLDNAVCVLCNLCRNNDINKDLIIKHGGAPVIVETILANFDSQDLLLTCFRTLGNLSHTKDNVHAIVDAGGVQGVVAGMTVHNEELELISIAIRVLTALATDLDEEHRAIMAQEGAVQAIVEVAANFTQDLEMESSALMCLNTLASEPYNAAMILKQDGTKVTLDACESLIGDAELIFTAMCLLRSLSQIPRHLSLMHAAKVTKGIVTSVNNHTDEEGIITHAMGAIKNLAFNEETANKMAADKPIQLIINLIKQHKTNPKVLAACYQALSGLSRSENNAQSMAKQTMKLLCKNFQRFKREASFVNYAFIYLANLCAHQSVGENVLDQSGDLDIVKCSLQILQVHNTDRDIMLRGLRALENIAYSEKQDVRDFMKEVGTVTECERWEALNQRDDVKAACKAVIAAVNRKKFEHDGLAHISFKQPEIEHKKADGLFKKVEIKMPELDPKTRNFLTAGQLVTKHSSNAAPKPRHLYVTANLKYIVWKDPKKRETEKQRMKTRRIRGTEVGRCSRPLQRKRLGKFVAKDECAFRVNGRDRNGLERSVDFEASTEKDRDKWVTAIDRLIAWNKDMKDKATKFGEAEDSQW